MKKKELNYSIIITIIAVFIYLISTAYISIYYNSTFHKYSFALHLLNIFSNIMLLLTVIVTAWYVVFTYFLLKTTNELNSSLLEPFVKINWNIISDRPEKLLKSTTSDYQKDSENSQWLSICIENVRKKVITSLTIEVSVIGESDSMSIKEKKYSFSDDSISVLPNVQMNIGILNLTKIPNNVGMICRVDKIEYKGEDSKESIFEYNGRETYVCNGTGNIMPQLVGEN